MITKYQAVYMYMRNEGFISQKVYEFVIQIM